MRNSCGIPWTFSASLEMIRIGYGIAISVHLSFPRKRDSTFSAHRWIPAFAGMTMTRISNHLSQSTSLPAAEEAARNDSIKRRSEVNFRRVV
jgi:hypothetical protein